MPGRRLITDREAEGRGFGTPDCAARRRVLAETIQRLDPHERVRLKQLAHANLQRWRQEAPSTSEPTVRVEPGDWGDVALAATREFGEMFAVLNMANAFVPGGAYVEGAVAQEENMFRRTDCHFSITEEQYDGATDRYRPEATHLLEGRDGRVYLDVEHPRICFRGSEDRLRPDLGYAVLPGDEVYPFYELRSAAVDLRSGDPFDPDEMDRRICAQLDTLTSARIRHAVLSAFGCGAFRNPADRVAQLYRRALDERRGEYDVIVFAIFCPGYGPNNFEPFARALAQ